MYTHIKILVNPTSGNGAGKKIFAAAKNLQCHVQETEPHNILNQVKNFISPNDVVIIAGGDGTVHQIVNALYRTGLYTQIKVALLPLGTGNDLASALQYPRLSLKNLLISLSGDVVNYKLALWRYGDIIFCNYLSFGLDAKILSRVIKWRAYFPKNRWITLILYFIAGVLGIFSNDSILVEINQKKMKLVTLIFSNINIYGGGAHVEKKSPSPSALAVIPIKNRWQFTQLMLTRFTRNPYPTEIMFSHIPFVCTSFYKEADGELIVANAPQISNIGELQLVIPKNNSGFTNVK